MDMYIHIIGMQRKERKNGVAYLTLKSGIAIQDRMKHFKFLKACPLFPEEGDTKSLKI